MKLELDDGDEYDKWCGEVFLTVKGLIIFHCTLCDDKFKNFPEYSEHVKQTHYQDSYFDSDAYGEDEIDAIVDDDSSKTFDGIAESQETDPITEVLIEIEADSGKEQDTNENSNELPTNDANEKLMKYNKQISSSNGQHKCNVCGLSFSQRFNMRAHMRRHFDQKRFKCFQCPKAFHTRTELDTHERRHRGERPYVCDECGRTFITAGNLTMHAKRHKNIRNHECLQCKKKFFDSHALKTHMIGHSQDRPYECSSCSAKFSRKKSLVVHQKIHENKREYQCEFCDACFNQKPGLYSHIKIKHNKHYPEEPSADSV